MKLIPKRKILDRQGISTTVMDMMQNLTNNSITNIKESGSQEAGIYFLINGGGSAINTGVAGYLPIPFDCEITAGELEVDQTGSIKIDIWKDTIGNFPPTDADTITGGSELEISAGLTDYDSALSGWTKTLSKNDILGFNVDSVSTVVTCTITLYVRKTGG